ncbi:MAG: Gfo/Idh/MocA family oxidoreductase [Victivallaceae bacterium]|nr:Gfo/Idh/MocA family oxidoreductase [Victivallaceae bacterium]
MSNKTLKIGMVGLDTSHCEAFTKLLNDENNEHHVAGAKVVKAFPGGSQLFSNSHNRVGQITENMQELDIEIVDSLEAVGVNVDAIMLESVDGRQHLEQFKALVKFGKPIFIDKPFTCSYPEAKSIADLAAEYNVPVMTASAIRYAAGLSELNKAGSKIHTCDTFGPMAILDDYPGYFWYGIHTVEMLYSFMGAGCVELKVETSENLDITIAKWNDGRVATLRGARFDGGGYNFGCTVSTDQAVEFSLAESVPPYYACLLEKIVPFFQTGKSPIVIEESLETIAFIDAMNESYNNNGKTVKLVK